MEIREPWQAAFRFPWGLGASPAARGKTGRSWCLPDAEEKQKVPGGGQSLPPPGDQQGMVLPCEESTNEWRQREGRVPGGC